MGQERSGQTGEAVFPFHLPWERRRWLQRFRRGKGGQAACMKRHVVSACEAAKLKAHTFGDPSMKVLTAQQAAFVNSIAV